MTKQITETEQMIVASMVSGFMDKLVELAPMMALSPEKGAHLLNLGIVSFIVSAGRHLDGFHAKSKNDPQYTKLNMYGKTFDTHLELFMELLQRGKIKES